MWNRFGYFQSLNPAVFLFLENASLLAHWKKNVEILSNWKWGETREDKKYVANNTKLVNNLTVIKIDKKEATYKWMRLLDDKKKTKIGRKWGWKAWVNFFFAETVGSEFLILGSEWENEEK